MGRLQSIHYLNMKEAIWLLPEGVEEILPQEAAQLETLRRTALDELNERNFALVMPPVMEFVDSLLTGTGEELDTQTYKFMDQHTHRMLGIRADMTPQIARIDAHYLAHNAVNRLCYVGTVLRTQPDQMGGQRELLQIGAEMFGVRDHSADLEVIDAMLSVLRLSNIHNITLSLGHVGLYRALLELCEIGSAEQPLLFEALLRKSNPDLLVLSQKMMGANIDLSAFTKLLNLQGSPDVLVRATNELPKSTKISQALTELQAVVEHLLEYHPDVRLHIDLADIFGYRYHTGLKFSAYVEGRGRTIAKGGRYDSIGERFGHARPATGFTADLKSLVKLGL